MRPVDQRPTPNDTGGDCLSACVASILELDIEEVPIFIKSENWIEALESWLRPRGLGLVAYTVQGAEYVSPTCLHIACGPSPLGGEHAVVMRGDELLHDGNFEAPDGITMVRYRLVIVPLPDAGQDRPELRLLRPPKYWWLFERPMVFLFGMFSVEVLMLLTRWAFRP